MRHCDHKRISLSCGISFVRYFPVEFPLNVNKLDEKAQKHETANERSACFDVGQMEGRGLDNIQEIIIPSFIFHMISAAHGVYRIIRRGPFLKGKILATSVRILQLMCFSRGGRLSTLSSEGGPSGSLEKQVRGP